MTRSSDIEELIEIQKTADWSTKNSEAARVLAANMMLDAGWTAPVRLVEAMWIAAGGDALAPPGYCKVICEVDVEEGQTVYITQSALHPNIRRRPEGAPTRVATHAAKAGEELRVK